MNCKHVFHLYVIRTRFRDKLQQHLQRRDTTFDTLSVPNHLQPALQYLGYTEGYFPVTRVNLRYKPELAYLPAGIKAK
jgi:dTDP-4-amino-4,6-dideoxygalactose transaminase